MSDLTLNNSIFVVRGEPYCIWEVNLKERNMEFLEGIDVEYFDYLIKIHTEADDEKRSSIALRTTLYHAMETFFSLLGAYIQAPDCVYAWIAKCSTGDLRNLVQEIGRPNSLFTKLNIEKVSWEGLAKLVLKNYLPGTERNEKTQMLFASLWRRLSYEYINQNYIDEYNSLKHGFRVRSGGFALFGGIEHEDGVPPPDSEMQVIGHSDFGTSFFKIEPIGEGKGNRSVRSRRVSINWKIEKVILLTQLVSMSINNILSALKIANGAKTGTCKFLRPVDDEDFEKPWTHSPGVPNCSFDFVINVGEVVSVTKKELLAKLRSKQ